MNVWIQLHDMSHADLPDGTIELATKALEDFDWEAEILKEEQAASTGTECCSPGMGFVSDFGQILHVIPASGNSSHYHYHYPQTKKLLGLIPLTSQTTVSVQRVPNSHRHELIKCHYDQKHSRVLELLNFHGKQWT